jgi:hypothetical protein
MNDEGRPRRTLAAQSNHHHNPFPRPYEETTCEWGTGDEIAPTDLQMRNLATPNRFIGLRATKSPRWLRQDLRDGHDLALGLRLE